MGELLLTLTRLFQPIPLNPTRKVSGIGYLVTGMRYRSLLILLGLVMTGFTRNHSVGWPVRQVDENGSFRSSIIRPVRVDRLSDDHYLVDFGQDAFGTLLLEFSKSPAAPLVIHLGEKLTGDGRIDREPGGTIRYQQVTLSGAPAGRQIPVQLPPDRRNTTPPAILLPDSIGVVMPFRYVEIEHLTLPVSEVTIRQKAVHYRFDDRASNFDSSDSILNRVWDLCKYTIKATSFAGLYVDGDRERIPYEADAYINQLSHYAVDDEYGMARATIRHFMDHPTWPTEWLLHTALMVYQDYYYTGDPTLLLDYYASIKAKTLYELAGENGLISSFSDSVTGEYMQRLGFTDTSQRIRDIVDWPPAQKDTNWKLDGPDGERDGHEMVPVNTVVNCFFYENMRIMAELAGVIGRNDDAADFSRMAARTKESINELLLDKEKGFYVDGIGSGHSSLHSNMLPLAFGLVPEDQLAGVVSFVKSRKMACSVYGAQYLLEGLYRAGEAEYALELMTSTGERSWWNMIRSGSTMTMEAWDMKFKPNADWNHAWGAAPGNIVTRFMWGIRPALPGFERVEVMPRLSGLKYSQIKVPTIRGPIHATYEKSGTGQQIFTVELPPGMEGRFVLALKEPVSQVILNGDEWHGEDGQIPLGSGENRILIQ